MAASKDRVSPKKRSKRGRKVRDLQHKIADLEEKFKTLQESLKNQPAPAPTTVAKTQSDPGTNLPWESDRVIQNIHRIWKDQDAMLDAHYTTRPQSAGTTQPRVPAVPATPNHGIPLGRVSPQQLRVATGTTPAGKKRSSRSKAKDKTARRLQTPTVTAGMVSAPPSAKHGKLSGGQPQYDDLITAFLSTSPRK